MLFLLLVIGAVTVNCDSFNPTYVRLNYSDYYDFNINKSVEYILDFAAEEVFFRSVHCDD